MQHQRTKYFRILEGTFWKDGGINTATDLSWGLSHTADSVGVHRGKGQFGSTGGNYNQHPAQIVSEMYEGAWGDGRHVDIVVCDDPVSSGCAEWMGFQETRFVPYQWFNELNTEVASIDDDGQTLPTGAVTYHIMQPILSIMELMLLELVQEIIMDLQTKQTYMLTNFRCNAFWSNSTTIIII